MTFFITTSIVFVFLNRHLLQLLTFSLGVAHFHLDYTKNIYCTVTCTNSILFIIVLQYFLIEIIVLKIILSYYTLKPVL